MPPDTISVYSLALGMNQDHMKLQLDAIAMVLFYLEEERRALREKHAELISHSY